MLLREALGIAASSKRSADRKVALVCGFEPLHLKTYLQAILSVALPAETPEVLTFGYDQLPRGIEETSTRLKTAPVLLCLSWEDIDPRLSWRSRGRMEAPTLTDLSISAARLEERLEQWLAARQGAETCIALPPIEWLPLSDPNPAFAVGPTAVAAQALIWRIAGKLARGNAKVLRIVPGDFNYRDLLQAGFPLSAEQSEILARKFISASCCSKDRKKVLVVDLDGTLWHGIIGEDGPAGIEYSAEGKGATFHVFQKFLAKLKGEGTLLAFCSKNSPNDVLPVFDTMEMPLKLSDFAAYRCNWESKSVNLRAIANELHVGLDALALVDDNEAELADIQAHAPEVVKFRTPEDGKEWQEFFQNIQDLFGTWSVSAEDKGRTKSFAQEHLRRELSQESPVGSGGLEHLKNFELELVVNPLAFADPRSLELINKTNQFNLTGERVSREQWLSWSANPNAFCFSARLKDRFGDFGIISIIAGDKRDDGLELSQFVLSCRAFGRGVEVLLLTEALQSVSCNWISGPFKDSGKNEPVRRFLSGLSADAGQEGHWRLSRATLQEASARVLRETGVRVRRFAIEGVRNA